MWMLRGSIGKIVGNPHLARFWAPRVVDAYAPNPQECGYSSSFGGRIRFVECTGLSASDGLQGAVLRERGR